MDIEWVIFDAVGTLIEPVPDVASAYHSVGVEFGSPLTIDEVRDRFRRAFQKTEEQDLAASSSMRTSEEREVARWREIVGDVFPEVSDLEACYQELHEYFGRPTAWHCYKDVEPTLTALRDHGFRLAIASNFDFRLHSICEGIPALRIPDRRFVSSEVGFRKPSPKFYQAIIQELGISAENVLMVGDGMDNDVLGAMQAGLNAVYLERNGAESDEPEKNAAFSVISDLSELEGVLS